MKFEIRVVEIEKPIDRQTFDFLLQYTEKSKRERILKLRSKQSADQILVGGILSAYMLLTHFHIPLEEQKFAYNANGKPYLPAYPQVHFNISHSGSLVVCAVCDMPVGVDVQQIVPYHPAVAKRVLSQCDINMIEHAEDTALAFTTAWARKEAYGKMLGCGLFYNEEVMDAATECRVLKDAVVAWSVGGKQHESGYGHGSDPFI